MRLRIMFLLTILLSIAACNKDDEGGSNGLTGHNGYIPKIKFKKFPHLGRIIYNGNRIVKIEGTPTSIDLIYDDASLLEECVFKTTYNNTDTINGIVSEFKTVIESVLDFKYLDFNEKISEVWRVSNKSTIYLNGELYSENEIVNQEEDFRFVDYFYYDDDENLRAIVEVPAFPKFKATEFYFESNEYIVEYDEEDLLEEKREYKNVVQGIKNPFYELYLQTGFVFFNERQFMIRPELYSSHKFRNYIAGEPSLPLYNAGYSYETNSEGWVTEMTLYKFGNYPTDTLSFSYQ